MSDDVAAGTIVKDRATMGGAGGMADQAMPNGPAAAALVATGIGSAALGLATVLVEVSPAIKKWLNLYDPVGPLSGKSTVAVVLFFASWLVLGLWWRRREVRFGRWAGVGIGLVVVGLVLTFPPVFQAFTAKP